jgi:hypothetical protein
LGIDEIFASKKRYFPGFGAVSSRNLLSCASGRLSAAVQSQFPGRSAHEDMELSFIEKAAHPQRGALPSAGVGSNNRRADSIAEINTID